MSLLPELPEVETIKNTLAPKIRGKEFVEVQVKLPKVIASPSPETFCQELKRKTVTELGRRGKYLLIFLTSNLTLILHLRLSGRLTYTPSPFPPARHTHVIFTFHDGAQLHFNDLRQFGQLSLVPTLELAQFPPLAKLGPEPLSPSFNAEAFADLISQRKGQLKPLLIDQTFLAGIGNIYADEILFHTGLSPRRSAATLTPSEVARLYQSICTVLEAGISSRGTSVRDYVDGEGKRGDYQNKLCVYAREKMPCFSCGNPIERQRLGGRSTYFCPTCQK